LCADARSRWDETVYAGSNGVTTQVKVYRGTFVGGDLLRKYDMEYGSSGTHGEQSDLLQAVITTLEDGRVSRKEFAYDVDTQNYFDCSSSDDRTLLCMNQNSPVPYQMYFSRGNVVQIAESDWGQAAPGPWKRRTTRVYQHDPRNDPTGAYRARNVVPHSTRNRS
jgi:hypothetical protein